MYRRRSSRSVGCRREAATASPFLERSAAATPSKISDPWTPCLPRETTPKATPLPRKPAATALALAWVQAQGDDIVTIPGTKRRAYLEQNVRAVDLVLTPGELAEIDAASPKGVGAGDRYPDMSHVNR